MYDSRWRSLDSNGNPISGATLTVYTAGTTTPAAIFRDAALAVPMSNPTSGADKADSAGRFPQIFAASGSLFDILEKDAGGSTIATYLNVSTLGTISAAQSYDFTNSRAALRGSGGTVYIEAGDASGDDIGGTMSIGGWLGTQADLISINAALVNILGRLKEGGYKLPGVVRQEAVAFTTVASVAIPLTNEPTGVRMFDIDVIDLLFSGAGAASVNLLVTFSFDGGSTYTATNYEWAINASYTTTNAPLGSATDTAAHIANAVDSRGNLPCMIRMSIVGTDGSSHLLCAMGQVNANSHTSDFRQTNTFSINHPATPNTRVTHMKLACSTGTFTGTYRVIPQRGLGEA